MSASNAISEGVHARTATICVVGLGYVGLPLAIAFDEAHFETIGFDVDTERIEAFSQGHDPTAEVGAEQVATSAISFTDDPTSIHQADFVLITVPTPLDNVQSPKLEFVEAAARTVGSYLTPGTTVVLESTVYPGVTRDVLVPILEDESGLQTPAEFRVGYSPERLSPGDDGVGLTDAVKVVGADTDETRSDLAVLYETIVDAGVYEADSIETAEAAKVLENVQRDLNIALMNEMAIICDHLGLDTHAVIEACSTKWNFHEYSPGLVGGHCIPVDPLYLAHGSERAGFSPNLILQAREINEYIPKHVADMTTKALNECGKVLQEARLLVLGVAYKPNVSDTRTSEVRNVIRELDEYGIECVLHDPIAETDRLGHELGVDTTDRLKYHGFDGIILGTPHDLFRDLDLTGAARELHPAPVFIDVHGAYDPELLDEAGFTHRRL